MSAAARPPTFSFRRLPADLHLTTSIVEMEPDGLQRSHRHDPEQIYYVISGTGLMSVENETWEIKDGDCVLVPAGSVHSLRNTGEDVLRYFSCRPRVLF